ncbi:unnamed protein product [Onchocerca flexuosa]|uniref:Uncharacterized protein n=1 Tax=Onchocerca flexuosa TaxID=387005 RepID=A0A183HMS4_9BILA|nr:unnamed protein product [Onchocerca flexuosa]
MDLAFVRCNIYNFRLAYHEKSNFLIQSNKHSSTNGNIYAEIFLQEGNLGEENNMDIGSCNGVSW